MKCKECGGQVVMVQAYSTDGEYEYVCSRCGLVYSPYEVNEPPSEPEGGKVKCRICGRPVSYRGRGRRPKYCAACAGEVQRMQIQAWKARMRKRNRLSERDIFLLAIQKRAS